VGRLWRRGGVYCEVDPGLPIYSQPTIKNCIFENNGGHAIHEFGDDSDPNLTFSLFHNNPDGDYYDWDVDDTFTDANNINSIPDGFIRRNKDGDPLFVMNSEPNAITGSWTADPELSGNRTVLSDSFGAFPVGELVGRHINANTSDPNQRRQAYITANTATTIEVIGDLTGYVEIGHDYKIINYHIRYGSPCIDTGTIFGSPPTDIEGNPRVDIIGIADITVANPNRDSIVNILDLILVANNWLRDDCQEPGSCDDCDMAPPSGDGVIDYSEFGLICSNWLENALSDTGAYEFQIDN
jgi:hypothetical protein